MIPLFSYVKREQRATTIENSIYWLLVRCRIKAYSEIAQWRFLYMYVTMCLVKGLASKLLHGSTNLNKKGA